MAKWHGKIGFGVTIETVPGVWVNQITERFYGGEILKSNIQNKPSDQVNNDVLISNRISILADPFATENIPNIQYVEFMGSLWRVSDVEINFPRMIISIGGVYNAVET